MQDLKVATDFKDEHKEEDEDDFGPQTTTLGLENE